MRTKSKHMPLPWTITQDDDCPGSYIIWSGTGVVAHGLPLWIARLFCDARACATAPPEPPKGHGDIKDESEMIGKGGESNG